MDIEQETERLHHVAVELSAAGGQMVPHAVIEFRSMSIPTIPPPPPGKGQIVRPPREQLYAATVTLANGHTFTANGSSLEKTVAKMDEDLQRFIDSMSLRSARATSALHNRR